MYNLFNFLSVAECFFVTNAGIATIATLPKLEVSIMNYLRLVTNINLWAASNLKRLECRDSKFTDRIIINAIESAIVCLSITCRSSASLQVGEHVHELYIVTMFVLHEYICTLAQIKPQINRPRIQYFVHSRLFTSIMHHLSSDNSLIMRTAGPTSTLKSASSILRTLSLIVLVIIRSIINKFGYRQRGVCFERREM